MALIDDPFILFIVLSSPNRRLIPRRLETPEEAENRSQRMNFRSEAVVPASLLLGGVKLVYRLAPPTL